MRVPTEGELAAIAAAYLTVTRTEAPRRETASRWQLAARLEAVGETLDGPAARGESRWKLAGRNDG